MAQKPKHFTLVDRVTAQYPTFTRSEPKVALRGEVTNADVAQSTPRDYTDCALCVAIRRITGADEVWISNRVAILIYKAAQRWERYRCPDKVAKMVARFDHVGRMPSGTYTLLPVERGARLGDQRKRKTGPHTSRKQATGKHTTWGYRLWIFNTPEV